MATTNTDAFPVNDTEYTIVDPAVNSGFTKFDYRNQEAQNDDLLKVHGVKLTEVQEQASTGQVVYKDLSVLMTLLTAAWPLTGGRTPLTLLSMTMLLSII